MDRYEQDKSNDRESYLMREESDLTGHTTSHRPGDDRKGSDAFDTSRGDRVHEHGALGTHDHRTGERDSYGENTGGFATGQSSVGERDSYGENVGGFAAGHSSGLDNTGSSTFDGTSTGDVRSYDSAETRFGTERPEMHGQPGHGLEDPLVSSRHDTSFSSEQIGRNDTYGSHDTSYNKPSGTVSYGEGVDQRYGGSVTSGHDYDNSKTSDSTMGKLMEKAGDALNKQGLAEKGREKRQAAAEDDFVSSED